MQVNISTSFGTMVGALTFRGKHLPGWLSVSPSGVLTGTPPKIYNNTNYTFDIIATSQWGTKARKTFTVTNIPTYVASFSATPPVGQSLILTTNTVPGTTNAGLAVVNGQLQERPFDETPITILVADPTGSYHYATVPMTDQNGILVTQTHIQLRPYIEVDLFYRASQDSDYILSTSSAIGINTGVFTLKQQ